MLSRHQSTQIFFRACGSFWWEVFDNCPSMITSKVSSSQQDVSRLYFIVNYTSPAPTGCEHKNEIKARETIRRLGGPKATRLIYLIEAILEIRPLWKYNTA